MKIINKAEIANKEFSTRANGYDATEVDTFLDAVIEFVGNIDNQNSLMREKIEELQSESTIINGKLEANVSEISNLKSKLENTTTMTSEFEFNSDRRAVDTHSRITNIEKILEELVKRK